ncbi:MAG: M48 family metallopeptidase [Vicingaceae bacterium]|nr:M48 family metallopeptidase [Flavobacteriales bacterium]MDF1676034.1 M48 family metallopeptidase [Vicingaceae bacterium]
MKVVNIIILIFGLLFFIEGVTGQTKYEFPNEIPEEYKLNPQEEFKKLSRIRKRGFTPTHVAKYAEMVSYGKANLLESGVVYFSWSEIEEYLNTVLQKLLPDSIKQISKVYLVRDPSYNAFAIHDGSFFVNIGLLADTYNEASLAVIIGHEISHFLHKDVENQFFENFHDYSKKNRNKTELQFKNAHNNQVKEHYADSLGFILANKAGYDIKFGLNNFYKFLLNEKEVNSEKVSVKTVNSKSNNKNKELTLLLSSHPKAQERISYLEKTLEDKNFSNKREYIVSENTFYKLQAIARKEVLKILLENNDFDECIRRAFEYYLLNPEEDTNIYYLLEAIRRKVYVFNNTKNDGFLTEDFLSNFNKGEGILNNINFLIRDSITFTNVKTTELLDTTDIKFNTYIEAYNYFKQIAINKNIIESYLTIALYEHEKELKEKYLKLYLESANINHKKFADALLNNRLNEVISEKENQVLYIKDILFLEDHYYGFHNNLIKRNENNEYYYLSINKMVEKHFPQKTVISSKKIKNTNFNRYIDNLNIMKNIFFYDEYVLDVGFSYSEGGQAEVVFFNEDSKNENFELNQERVSENSIFTLNPMVWDYYNENNIKSFEFVNIINYDDQTSILSSIGNTILNVFLIPFGQFSNLNLGSNRYIYEINYARYDGVSNTSLQDERVVNFKMRRPYLNNTVYHLLHIEDYE